MFFVAFLVPLVVGAIGVFERRWQLVNVHHGLDIVDGSSDGKGKPGLVQEFWQGHAFDKRLVPIDPTLDRGVRNVGERHAVPWIVAWALSVN